MESVTTDHTFGAGLAIRHLAAEGHRRVGFLASATSPTTAAVRRGWRETAAQIGLDLDAIPDAITPDHREPAWTYRRQGHPRELGPGSDLTAPPLDLFCAAAAAVAKPFTCRS